MGIKIGIDLGTTFSAAAVLDKRKGIPVIIPNRDGERITPSVIQFQGKNVIVGSEAKDAYESGESGCTSAFKRSMGSDEVYCTIDSVGYTPVKLSAIMLRHIKNEVEAVTGETVDEAVVTVPAYFYHKERSATLDAARLAGLKVKQLINEPTAAALAYSIDHWRENARIMVYDLGGGTFDVTLIQMKSGGKIESLRTKGDHTLGGKDWDARLTSLIESKAEFEAGLTVNEYPQLHNAAMRAAESVKKQLSTKNIASLRLSSEDFGKFKTEIGIDEFNKATFDLLKRTTTLCEQLLSELNLSWNDITDILLVGGSTRMRQVSAFLKERSGHTPLMHVNPDEAVALGAAICVWSPQPEYNKGVAGSISHENPSKHTGRVGTETKLHNALSIMPSDVCAHAMGVIAVSADGKKYINKTIVPANSIIPVKCAESFHYYTGEKDDNELEIYMLQGEKTPLESEVIGKYTVCGIKHDPKNNPTVVSIQYSYDLNGMVHVQVRQQGKNADLKLIEDPVPKDMSKFSLPPEKVTASAQPQQLNVVMAVDVSGSMNGYPLKEAKKAMCHFVDKLRNYPGTPQVGVVAVSDRSIVVMKLDSDLNKCKIAINSIEEEMAGILNGADPFEDIRRMLRNAVGRRWGIVLADGRWDDQPKAVRAAKMCHELGIDIVGIGFGTADEKFLKDISSGEIESMFVGCNELVESFGKIAQEIGETSPKRLGRSNKVTAVSTWRAIGETQ